MSDLADYVIGHTVRGECKCGRCIDVASQPDPHGHTADLIFFKTALNGEPSSEELRKLIAGHSPNHGEAIDLFDGKEHGFAEIGAWLGSQEVALLLMGLGSLLGLWTLMTPRTVLPPGLPDDLVMKMAQAGYVTARSVTK